MPCNLCKDSPGGAYNIKCVNCCARLVISARPSKTQQEDMLAVIERHKGCPSRADILEIVKKTINYK